MTLIQGLVMDSTRDLFFLPECVLIQFKEKLMEVYLSRKTVFNNKASVGRRIKNKFNFAAIEENVN